MRFFKIFTLSIFFTVNVNASVYTGTSHWWNSDGFTEMGLVGAPYLSIENALNECRSAGNQYCEYLTTQPVSLYTQNGVRHIKHLSTVRSISTEQMSSYSFEQVFRGNASVTGSTVSSAMEQDAVRIFSLTRQITECQKAGCDICLPRSTVLLEVNHYREGAYWTTAESLIDCFQDQSQFH